MTKARLKEVCQAFMVYLHITTNDWGKVYDIMSNDLNLSDNEIDELSGNFDDEEFEEEE